MTNTIPTTFNERKVAHTIVGGMHYRGAEQSEDFCVIVLNRGRKYYRPLFFEQLLAEGFTSVISIEPNTDTGDMENLSAKYPQIRFLFPQEKLTVGEMINIGFAETAAPYIMVMWNDTHIPPGSFTERILEKVKQEHLFCAAPVLSNIRGEAVPNQIVPSLNGNHFSTEQLPCIKNKTATIYPYDVCNSAGSITQLKIPIGKISISASALTFGGSLSAYLPLLDCNMKENRRRKTFLPMPHTGNST